MRGILVFLCIFIFTGCSDGSDKVETSEGKDTGRAELVSIEIGKHHFVMPRIHFSNKDFKGGKIKNVNLEIILPELKNHNQEINLEVKKKGYDNKIFMNLVETKNHFPINKDFERQRKYFSSPEDLVELGDLKLHHFTSPNETSLDELYAIMKGNQIEYYVVCYKATMVPYPNCKSSINYAPDLSIEYIFDRQHLLEWLMIGQKVNQAIKGFERIS